MIYRKPDGGLEKQYRDKGGRAVWERSSMANLFTRVSIRKFQDKKIEKKDLEYILRGNGGAVCGQPAAVGVLCHGR